MSCRSAQHLPRKNLSTSIFIFSLLSLIYRSYTNQRSIDRQGLPSVSLAALLLHFNKRYSPQLYNLVGSKVVSSRKRRQLFLFSFRIIFLSLFFKAIQLQQQQTSPITLYCRLTLLIPISSYIASSDYFYRAYLLGRAFR